MRTPSPINLQVGAYFDIMGRLCKCAHKWVPKTQHAPQTYSHNCLGLLSIEWPFNSGLGMQCHIMNIWTKGLEWVGSDNVKICRTTNQCQNILVVRRICILLYSILKKRYPQFQYCQAALTSNASIEIWGEEELLNHENILLFDF